jgi:hypothetical protein
MTRGRVNEPQLWKCRSQGGCLIGFRTCRLYQSILGFDNLSTHGFHFLKPFLVGIPSLIPYYLAALRSAL